MGQIGDGSRAPVALVCEEFSREHTQAGHPESRARLDAVVERLRAQKRLPSDCWRTAPLATPLQVRRIHSAAHLARLEGLCLGGGGWVDPDTYCVEASWKAALGAAGAALAAVDCVAARPSLPAFSLARPPGHHATPERAMGFCLLNNVAIAARYAQAELGVTRLAIVDLDAHHGNGTQDAFYEDGDVLYCSLHQWPLYPGTGRPREVGEGPGQGANLNLLLAPGSGPGTWLDLLKTEVVPRLRRHQPELLLVSAGFDALRGDPLADLQLEPQTFAAAAALLAELGAEFGQGGTAWVLEGGYDLSGMAEAVELTVLELAGLGSGRERHRDRSRLPDRGELDSRPGERPRPVPRGSGAVAPLGSGGPKSEDPAMPRSSSKTAPDGHVEVATGDSHSPQARKLGLKPGLRVGLDNRPPGWALTDPPDGLVYVESGQPADLILSFFTGAEQLPLRLPSLTRRIYPAGALWIAWPRRAGGHASDITNQVIRAHALALGVVDVKVAAIDEAWSGQRLVWRKANRLGL